MPHDLIVGSKVEILNVTSTNNTGASKNLGFNGKFTVTGISSITNEFSVEIPTDPGTFTGTSSLRVTNIPRFKKVFTKDSFVIYRSEEVQEFVQGQQDGIYNLTVLNASNSPNIEPYTTQNFLQPVKNLYPQLDRDNLKSDPDPSVSYAVSDTLGKVVLNDPEKSETKETINKFLYNFGSSNRIVSILKSADQFEITTEKNHEFNTITKISINDTGRGYGSGSIGSFYGVKLSGGTGEGATATISVNSTGQLTGAKITNGGSGYTVGDTLSLVGISTFAPHTEASFNVGAVSDCIDDIVELTGFNHNQYNSFGRITAVTNPNKFRVTLDNYAYHTENDEPDLLDLSNARYHPVGTKAIDILAVTVNSSEKTLTLTSTSPQDTVKLKVGDTIRISNLSSSSAFDVNSTKNIDRSFVITSVSQFNYTVKYGNISERQLSTSLAPNFIFKNGYSSKAGPAETISARTVPIYNDVVGTLQGSVVTKTTDLISISGLVDLGLTIGDYLQINNEIFRIKTTVTTNPGVTGVEVFRGVLGSEASTHTSGDPIKRIKVLPVELRRNSLIRASAHTFEYIGFGPGNYSTAFPEKQDRKLTPDEEKLAHSLRYDGGISVFSSMNADGNFYIGNKKINSASGKEEVFDIPVPSNVGETDYKKTDYNIVSSDKVSVSKSIKVSGGKDTKDISEFYGPVFFGDKITSTSSKGLESVSLFLQGDETISRKFTISATQPTIAGNPGDIVFNSNPPDGSLIAWIYTTGNEWLGFGVDGGILLNPEELSADNHYLTFSDQLNPPGQIEELSDSSRLYYTPATGELTSEKYSGDGGNLDNIHPAALIPRDSVKTNDSFDNYLYETKKSYTLTDNKTITGNSNYGDTVFTSLDTINIASGVFTVTSGTRFVVGEISGAIHLMMKLLLKYKF